MGNQDQEFRDAVIGALAELKTTTKSILERIDNHGTDIEVLKLNAARREGSEATSGTVLKAAWGFVGAAVLLAAKTLLALLVGH